MPIVPVILPMILAVLALAVPPAVAAQATDEAQAASVGQESVTDATPPQPTLDELLWIARPIVVFADSPADPRFAQQIAMLDERLAELEDRDVVLLTDTDPAARGPLRTELRPRGFNLVLIDKDGTVVQRRPAPITAREIINLIDRLPSRRQETGSLRQ
jgi:hypothetical protein